MKTRKLGSGGLEVPAVGLGCMVLEGFYAPGGADQSIATLHRAAEIGVNFLDTANLYGLGRNEELIGRAIKGRRDDYILATKFGNVRNPDGSAGVNGRPEHVFECFEASVKRLGVDYVELYYQHRVDPEVPIEETIGAMAQLVEQGKVGHLGISEASPDSIRRAHATHPIAALQTEYSLWTREAEADVLPLCKELGIGYVAYSPLGRGILGGDVKSAGSLAEGDRRLDHPRYQGENLEKNLTLLPPLLEIAANKGVSPAQVALAWLLAQGEHIVAIPGTQQIAHLEANAAAVDLELSPEELAALDAAFPVGAASGERYPLGHLKWLKR